MEWVSIVRKSRKENEWMASKFCVICSLHFNEEDYYLTNKGLRRLKKLAKPTQLLYELSSTPQISGVVTEGREGTSPHPSISSHDNDALNSIGDDKPLIPQRKEDSKFKDSDSDSSIFDTPREYELRKKLKRYQLLRVVSKRNQKRLRQAVRRLQKRNASLNNILKELKDKNFINCDSHKQLCPAGMNLVQCERQGLPSEQGAAESLLDTDDAGSDRGGDNDGFSDSDSDGLIPDPGDLSDFLVFNQGVPTTASDAEPCASTSAYGVGHNELVFNQGVATAASDAEPCASTSVHGVGHSEYEVEEVVIKEEISEEEKNQCRLCLSVGRRMQELADYAPLYRKLLYVNCPNTKVPSFMYEMLACWECRAELRRIQKFQDKVRRANAAFETSQNHKCGDLSNLSAVLIAEPSNPNPEDRVPSTLEECAKEIKEEPVEEPEVEEPEIEESALPDPLAVHPSLDPTHTGQTLDIEYEPNTHTQVQKTIKQPKVNVQMEAVTRNLSGKAQSTQVQVKRVADDASGTVNKRGTHDTHVSVNKLETSDTVNKRGTNDTSVSVNKLGTNDTVNKRGTNDTVNKRGTDDTPGTPGQVKKRPRISRSVQGKSLEEVSQGADDTPLTSQPHDVTVRANAPIDCEAIFTKVKIELTELQSILNERRNKDTFKSMQYKCDSCVLGFTDQSRLDDHNRNFHSKDVGSCECDICERRFVDPEQLAAHYGNHFVKFACKLCQFECYTKTGRAVHFTRHRDAVRGAEPDAVLRQRLISRASANRSSS